MKKQSDQNFGRFLKIFTILLGWMSIFSLFAAAYYALNSQRSESFDLLRSAVIFGVFFWLGKNFFRMEDKIKSKS